jgi:hypothetical protein
MSSRSNHFMKRSMSGGAAPLPTAYLKRFFGLRATSARIFASSPPYCFSSASRM